MTGRRSPETAVRFRRPARRRAPSVLRQAPPVVQAPVVASPKEGGFHLPPLALRSGGVDRKPLEGRAADLHGDGSVRDTPGLQKGLIVGGVKGPVHDRRGRVVSCREHVVYKEIRRAPVAPRALDFQNQGLPVLGEQGGGLEGVIPADGKDASHCLAGAQADPEGGAVIVPGVTELELRDVNGVVGIANTVQVQSLDQLGFQLGGPGPVRLRGPGLRGLGGGRGGNFSLAAAAEKQKGQQADEKTL